jgi:hypothetical protein
MFFGKSFAGVLEFNPGGTRGTSNTFVFIKRMKLLAPGLLHIFRCVGLTRGLIAGQIIIKSEVALLTLLVVVVVSAVGVEDAVLQTLR